MVNPGCIRGSALMIANLRNLARSILSRAVRMEQKGRLPSRPRGRQFTLYDLVSIHPAITSTASPRAPIWQWLPACSSAMIHLVIRSFLLVRILIFGGNDELNLARCSSSFPHFESDPKHLHLRTQTRRIATSLSAMVGEQTLAPVACTPRNSRRSASASLVPQETSVPLHAEARRLGLLLPRSQLSARENPCRTTPQTRR